MLTYGNAIAVLSIVAAVAAIYLAFIDSKGAALSMGGLFAAMAIISQLQNFKSFKAFTVEAEMRDTINEAQDLIKQLRELSILVAKAGYGSTGISMLASGGLQTSELTLTKDFDNLLSKLKLSKAELADARKPLMRVAALKIVGAVSNVSSALINLKATDEVRGKDIGPPDFGMPQQDLQHKIFTIDTPEQLGSILKIALPVGLNKEQAAAADKYIESLKKIYADCQTSGVLTPEFLALDKKVITQEGAPETAKAIFEGKSPV